MRTACMLAMVTAAAAGYATAEQVIYQTDFVDAPGERWSVQTVTDAPADDDPFLGRFTNEPVQLTLTDLPAHDFVRIEFDLHMIRTWDGFNTTYGPDYWKMTTGDGRTWIDATFTNFNKEYKGGHHQSYPTVLHGERTIPSTGSVARNQLGWDRSTTYRVSFTFPHVGDAIDFAFQARGLQDVEDESWGIDNLRVTVLGEADVPALDAAAMDALIAALRAEDPVAAEAAMRQAIAQGERFVEYIDQRRDELRIVANAEQRRSQANEWIAQLDADEYAVREKATLKLAERRALTQPLVEAKLKQDVSPETRWRLKKVLEDGKPGPIQDPVYRLELRLRRTLELIGTPKAKTIAEQLPALPKPMPMPVAEK